MKIINFVRPIWLSPDNYALAVSVAGKWLIFNRNKDVLVRNPASGHLRFINKLDAAAFQVGEYDGGDGLDDDGGAEGEADIVATGDI